MLRWINQWIKQPARYAMLLAAASSSGGIGVVNIAFYMCPSDRTNPRPRRELGFACRCIARRGWRRLAASTRLRLPTWRTREAHPAIRFKCTLVARAIYMDNMWWLSNTKSTSTIGKLDSFIAPDNKPARFYATKCRTGVYTTLHAWLAR